MESAFRLSWRAGELPLIRKGNLQEHPEGENHEHYQ
jgi:hypothetical protein